MCTKHSSLTSDTAKNIFVKLGLLYFYYSFSIDVRSCFISRPSGNYLIILRTVNKICGEATVIFTNIWKVPNLQEMKKKDMPKRRPNVLIWVPEKPILSERTG